MTELYPSTKALSVYNVLSMTKHDLTRTQVDVFLRQHFDVNLPDDFVELGAQFLLDRGFVTDVDGVLTIDRFTSGFGKPLIRSRDDRDLLRGSY